MGRGRLLVAALAVLGCVIIIAGCASYGSARHPHSRYHLVRAGDTLYSIAWEAGRDYHQVAAWNGLSPPYLIRPGQRLRLFPPGASRLPRISGDEYVVARGDTLSAIAAAAGVHYRELARWNRLSPPYVIHPGQRLRVTPPAATRARAAPAPAPGSGGALAWRWPAQGALIARFAPQDGSKGIAIGGDEGQPIEAAADGRVVYQGSGLRGYGQLIIIKHNADFLSAYAHCAKTFVQEGNTIRAGQKIAIMGSTGTNRVKLYFEIRRRGTPVDPLIHLPKK